MNANSLRDFFPQATLFLLAIFIELAVPLFLPTGKQKRVVKLLGLALLCVSLGWLVVACASQATLETPSSPAGQLPTQNANSSITNQGDNATIISQTNISTQNSISTSVVSETNIANQNDASIKGSVISESTAITQAGDGINIGAMEGDNNIVVQGEGNTVTVGNKLPELTDENIDRIVVDLLPRVDAILYKVIVRPYNQKPLLFIVFQIEGRLYARAIQNEGEVWDIKWELSYEDAPLFTMDQNNYVVDDRYVVFTGCKPHLCIAEWGFLFFDAVALDGWLLVPRGSGFDFDPVTVDTPRGYPEDPYTLYTFQWELYQQHSAENFDEVLLALPAKKNIPPMQREYMNYDRVLAKIGDFTVREIYAVFWADIDRDNILEWVAYTNNGDLIDSVRIYVIDGEKVELVYTAEEFTGLWSYFGTYPSVDGFPYLVFGTMLGAAGSVVDVTIYQYNGQTYVPVLGDDKTFMRRELGIRGWPYD